MTFADVVLWLNETRFSEGFNIIAGHISEDGRLVIFTSLEKAHGADNDQAVMHENNRSTARNSFVGHTLMLDEVYQFGKLGEPDTTFNTICSEDNTDQNGLADWAYL